MSKSKSYSCVFSSLLLLVTFSKDAFALKLEATPGTNKPIGTFVPKVTPALALKGSRKEVLNFILRLQAKNCVTFELPKDFPIQLYEMPYFKTTHASFPGAYIGSHHDPLPPVNKQKVCPTPGVPVSWIFGEILIPSSATPGVKALQITAKEEKEVIKLPVQLTVWKMSIPEKPAMPLYAEYTSWYGVKGHYGGWDSKEGTLAQSYAKAMRAHRMTPLKFWVSVPKMITTKNKTILNLEEPIGKDTSFQDIPLKSRASWEWIDFPNPFNLKAENEKDSYWRGVEDAIQKENLIGKACVYLWDEPKKTEYPEMLRRAAQIKRLAPDLKVLVTTSGYKRRPKIPELEKNVDIFVPVMNDWGSDFNAKAVDQYYELKKSGKELWTYVSCMSHGCSEEKESGLPDWVIDRPTVSIRVMTWILNRMKVDSFLYYAVNYAYQYYPQKDPWIDQWYFSGNGEGNLFYPGRPGGKGVGNFSQHQPVDSIRLKAWRESSFDAEYIHWMEALKEKPAFWTKAYEALVKSPTEWSKDYNAFQILRDQAGDYLNQLP